MAQVVDIRTRKKVKPEGIPENCYLRFSTPTEDGTGPVYVEWNGVSPQLLLVAEEAVKDLKEILFHIIQGTKEDTG